MWAAQLHRMTALDGRMSIVFLWLPIDQVREASMHTSTEVCYCYRTRSPPVSVKPLLGVGQLYVALSFLFHENVYLYVALLKAVSLPCNPPLGSQELTNTRIKLLRCAFVYAGHRESYGDLHLKRCFKCRDALDQSNGLLIDGFFKQGFATGAAQDQQQPPRQQRPQSSTDDATGRHPFCFLELFDVPFDPKKGSIAQLERQLPRVFARKMAFIKSLPLTWQKALLQILCSILARDHSIIL